MFRATAVHHLIKHRTGNVVTHVIPAFLHYVIYNRSARCLHGHIDTALATALRQFRHGCKIGLLLYALCRRERRYILTDKWFETIGTDVANEDEGEVGSICKTLEKELTGAVVVNAIGKCQGYTAIARMLAVHQIAQGVAIKRHRIGDTFLQTAALALLPAFKGCSIFPHGGETQIQQLQQMFGIGSLAGTRETLGGGCYTYLICCTATLKGTAQLRTAKMCQSAQCWQSVDGTEIIIIGISHKRCSAIADGRKAYLITPGIIVLQHHPCTIAERQFKSSVLLVMIFFSDCSRLWLLRHQNRFGFPIGNFVGNSGLRPGIAIYPKHIAFGRVTLLRHLQQYGQSAFTVNQLGETCVDIGYAYRLQQLTIDFRLAYIGQQRTPM